MRYRLRDVDSSSIADAVQPVALQYRLGSTGDFTPVPGGFVSDATTGPEQATQVTPVSTVLPTAADDRPLVQLRILATNAVGQDEWVGVDDIQVEASSSVCGPSGQPRGGKPVPPPVSPTRLPPASSNPPPALRDLTLMPRTFPAAKRGRAVSRTGRAGASLRFRMTRGARVEFLVTSSRRPEPGRFSVRGRRGLNRLRFGGRLRGRALPAGPYRLTASAIARDGPASPPTSVGFRIKRMRQTGFR